MLLIRERNRERLKKNRGNSEESALVAIRPGHQSLELTELLKIKIKTGTPRCQVHWEGPEECQRLGLTRG